MRRCLSSLVIALLIATDAAAEPEYQYLQALGDTRYHVVESSYTEQRYHLFVRLPDDYEESKETYPVVYLLDGGWLFPLVSGYYKYLKEGDEMPSMIIVGISYGTDDFRQGNNRSTDYTAASAEREHWGGAPKFQQSLAAEVMPLIESTYRAREDRRILFGQSIGGQFVLYAALTEPQMFWGYIASNPALHRNLPYFLERHDNPEAALDARVFVASGSEDDATFRGPALQWMRHWTSTKAPPWSLCAADLAGHSHFSAAPAAFRDGIRWLFDPGVPGANCRSASAFSDSDRRGSLPR